MLAINITDEKFNLSFDRQDCDIELMKNLILRLQNIKYNSANMDPDMDVLERDAHSKNRERFDNLDEK